MTSTKELWAQSRPPKRNSHFKWRQRNEFSSSNASDFYTSCLERFPSALVGMVPSTPLGRQNLGRNRNSSVCTCHFTPLILLAFTAFRTSSDMLLGPHTKMVPFHCPSEACCLATFSNQAVMLSWCFQPNSSYSSPKPFRWVGQSSHIDGSKTTEKLYSLQQNLKPSASIICFRLPSLQLHTAQFIQLQSFHHPPQQRFAAQCPVEPPPAVWQALGGKARGDPHAATDVDHRRNRGDRRPSKRSLQGDLEPLQVALAEPGRQPLREGTGHFKGELQGGSGVGFCREDGCHESGLKNKNTGRCGEQHFSMVRKNIEQSASVPYTFQYPLISIHLDEQGYVRARFVCWDQGERMSHWGQTGDPKACPLSNFEAEAWYGKIPRQCWSKNVGLLWFVFKRFDDTPNSTD